MAPRPIRFVYLTGLRRESLGGARLTGSWDSQGRYSDRWSIQDMEPFVAEDGCPAFHATVDIDDAGDRRTFHWGVYVDGPAGANLWGIPTEVEDHASGERYRSFDVDSVGEEERYHLTYCRRLGANKLVLPDGSAAISFSVWAPSAQAVEVVTGDPGSGYIADSGKGVTSPPGAFPMTKEAAGIWHTDRTPSAGLSSFEEWNHQPYMFKITNEQGQVRYRTDLYSRCQIGGGRVNPAHLGDDQPPFSGWRGDLDGTVSCSVVVDPERVTELFSEGVWPETRWLSEDAFWADEFDPERPVPTRVKDLVIYELHVGNLGFGRKDPQGRPRAGTLRDAIDHLDYLVDLGVNAVELLPLAEFQDRDSWGYATSHHFAIEYSGGGRDQFKHFVRECHRKGLAVIMDVVYNHYAHEAERAQWHYDSDAPEHNIYYWYEGRATDYPREDGGYVDNESTGYAPRLWEETVRQLFISSAAALVTEFHVDGFRVDQTTALHSYARIHANGHRTERANVFGAKFLREWTRTMRLIKPDVMLMAEDHSGWPAVTEPTDGGGLGFDAVWYADFYHHLVGDGEHGPEYAKLIRTAGLGDDQPLAMGSFARALTASGSRRVVYHESHDEAGNARRSGRTIAVAVNWAPLVGQTRRFAEARARLAAALCLLSAGTPLFFMGEEVGATSDYRYADFVRHQEDLATSRVGVGAGLFRCYQDLIRLRRRHHALRSPQLEVVHVRDPDRVLAFCRSDGHERLLVIASLANRPYGSGYPIAHPQLGRASWQELFNSDSAIYGGDDVGNAGAIVLSDGGALKVVVPANAVLVFGRV